MASIVAGSEAVDLYLAALRSLRRAGVPFLVGGAYALERYTGICRDTKDLDVFVRPADCEVTLRAVREAGFKAEVVFPHWLAKALTGHETIDIIFSSGNGCAQVDDGWFEHGVADRVLDLPVRLVPPEEMIWSKAFIMERERYDGADIAHLLRARAATLDWARLLRRFGPHWPVLLSHLTLFFFVYPGHRHTVPARVMRELLRRLEREAGQTTADERTARLCRGTLLSRAQYLVDTECWGYHDARLAGGTMSEADIAAWTSAIDEPRPSDGR